MERERHAALTERKAVDPSTTGSWYGRAVVQIDQKAISDDGPGEISGFASVYGNVDLQDDLMERGAFDKSVAEWGKSKAKVPLIDWHGHSLSALIGSLVEVKSTAVGLWFRARFATTPEAQAARQQAKDGHLSGVSIGYLPIKQSIKMIGDRMVRVLHEVRLLEVSLTPVPANPEAQLASVKALAEAKGAIAPHSTATVDAPWDAGPVEAALPDGDQRAWKTVFAWYDASAADGDGDGLPDAKGAWKFPHHTKAGGPANLAGVRNGLARLPGASIPDGDRAGVERHLRGHLPSTAGLTFEQLLDGARTAAALPEAAYKAAMAAMLADYDPAHDDPAAGPADGPPTAGAAATTGPEPAGDTAATQAEAEHLALRHRIDDATAYALRVIHLEPRDGALVGTPPLARAGALAPLEVAQAMGDLDRLEAELRPAEEARTP